jgi:hypothetical protein
MKPESNFDTAAIASVLLGCLLLAGCGKQTASDSDSEDASSAADSPSVVIVAPKTYEASAQQLLDARLPSQQAAQGRLRLFDGHTLYGWEIAGAANWSVADQVISVDGGQTSLLCTSMPWMDFELSLDFRCDPQTDSGVFLRTPLDPDGSGIDCFEVNLSDQDPQFPTGSIVGKQKAKPLDESPAGSNAADSDWRSLLITARGNDIRVSIGGQEVCQYTDPIGFPAGRIGLQYKQGRADFRNIQLRPLGLESQLDRQLSKWNLYPDMPGKFSVTRNGWLHASGGKNQIETKQAYDDFVLLAEFKMPKAEMNSGIFFRCIEGSEMMGYECQLSNEMAGDNPLIPADHGTGGFFKRQNARLVAGLVNDWSTVVLVADGATMAAWVQGIQVSNWYDDRPPNNNPRKGSKVEPGTIMIQGHDPQTDAYFRQFAIAELE